MTYSRIMATLLLLLLHSKDRISLTESFAPILRNNPKIMTSFAGPAQFSSSPSLFPRDTSLSSSLLILSAGKGKKLSQSEKRKRRGKKLAPGPKMEPHGLPRPDVWDKTSATTTTSTSKDQSPKANDSNISDGDSVKADAKAIIDTQRKSVDVLTQVRTQVDALSQQSILQALSSPSFPHYYHTVIDNFLGDDLCDEMSNEGRSMLDGMELDIEGGGICSGEYVAAIVGGKEQYVDCPRCVEYVVSLTRHLPLKLADGDGEKEDGVTGGSDSSSLGFRLDGGASMASIRTFDRSARLSALKLLFPDSSSSDIEARPFNYIVDGKIQDDRRKVTALYFMVPDGWNAQCGGGVRIKTVANDNEGSTDDSDNEVLIEAKNDRLLIFRSDLCLHSMEGWVGGDGLEVGSHLETHFIQS